MIVISSAILERESVRADVSAESLMVLSFILKLLKIKKDLSYEILWEYTNIFYCHVTMLDGSLGKPVLIILSTLSSNSL